MCTLMHFIETHISQLNYLALTPPNQFSTHVYAPASPYDGANEQIRHPVYMRM